MAPNRMKTPRYTGQFKACKRCDFIFTSNSAKTPVNQALEKIDPKAAAWFRPNRNQGDSPMSSRGADSLTKFYYTHPHSLEQEPLTA
jgi:hypothetical protein